MPQTVLIVDDSATTRAMIKRIVTLCGIDAANVLQAADGKEGLDVLDSNDVDLVLADLHMPVMGGEEMVHEMRRDEALKTIPVVVVSADPNLERLQQRRQGYAIGVVRKPVTPEALSNALKSVRGAADA